MGQWLLDTLSSNLVYLFFIAPHCFDSLIIPASDITCMCLDTNSRVSDLTPPLVLDTPLKPHRVTNPAYQTKGNNNRHNRILPHRPPGQSPQITNHLITCSIYHRSSTYWKLCHFRRKSRRVKGRSRNRCPNMSRDGSHQSSFRLRRSLGSARRSKPRLHSTR